jgi:hypothetical protein
MEASLRLLQHRPGTLTGLHEYLFGQSNGMIGSLSQLVRDAAILAIRDGTKQISKQLLDLVPVDHAAQRATNGRPGRRAKGKGEGDFVAAAADPAGTRAARDPRLLAAPPGRSCGTTSTAWSATAPMPSVKTTEPYERAPGAPLPGGAGRPTAASRDPLSHPLSCRPVRPCGDGGHRRRG